MVLKANDEDSLTDELANEEVLRRAGVERKLIDEIRTRQMRFLRRWVGGGGGANAPL